MLFPVVTFVVEAMSSSSVRISCRRCQRDFVYHDSLRRHYVSAHVCRVRISKAGVQVEEAMSDSDDERARVRRRQSHASRSPQFSDRSCEVRRSSPSPRRKSRLEAVLKPPLMSLQFTGAAGTTPPPSEFLSELVSPPPMLNLGELGPCWLMSPEATWRSSEASEYAVSATTTSAVSSLSIGADVSGSGCSTVVAPVRIVRLPTTSTASQMPATSELGEGDRPCPAAGPTSAASQMSAASELGEGDRPRTASLISSAASKRGAKNRTRLGSSAASTSSSASSSSVTSSLGVLTSREIRKLLWDDVSVSGLTSPAQDIARRTARCLAAELLSGVFDEENVSAVNEPARLWLLRFL